MDNGVASLGPCFAQLSLTSCVPETAAAGATQQQHHPAATMDTAAAAAATNYSREITTITISTETAKPNIVPVFIAVVVVVVVLAFFASNYKHIRLTQMHNKMSLDLRQKTEIKPEKEQEKARERENGKEKRVQNAITINCMRLAAHF